MYFIDADTLQECLDKYDDVQSTSSPQRQYAWYFADEATEAEQIERFGTLSHIREIAADQFMSPMSAEVERLKVLNSCLPDLKFP